MAKGRFDRVQRRVRNVPGGGCLLAAVTIPVVLFACWLWSHEQEAKSRERQANLQRQKEDQRRWKLPPEISLRERRLSIDAKREKQDRAGNVVRRRGKSQMQAKFFELPWELREMIWKEYFEAVDGKEVLVVLRNGRLRPWTIERDSEEERLGKWEVERKARMLSFLITCRRVYNEGINFLYSMPTYTFIDPISFLAFSHHILPSRLNNIQHLCLDFIGDVPRYFRSAKWYKQDYSLNNELTYRDLHVSHIEHFHNSPSSLVSSEKVSRPTRPPWNRKTDTFWTATCRAVESMESLRSLDINVPRNTFRADLDITKPLERPRFRELKSFGLRVEIETVQTGQGWNIVRERKVERWVEVLGSFGGWEWVSSS